MRTIIVGAGIAGLWIADKLVHETDDEVIVLEKGAYVGGRVITSKKYGYEIGAGRIDLDQHHHILALIKRFGLKTYEHGSGSLWKSLKDSTTSVNHFDSAWQPLLALFATLDPAILGTHTLRELSVKAIGAKQTSLLLRHFPYRAETETMRADLGLRSFRDEMSEKQRFGAVVGGLSKIVQGLATSVQSGGGQIHLNTTVTDVKHSDGVYTVMVGCKLMTADRVILAMPLAALRPLPFLKHLSLLDRLKMKPLTRIYSKMVGPWPFPKRIITDSPLRYIIPIRPDEGVVMISYTESQDTHFWKGLTDDRLVKALTKELQRLFPTLELPKIESANAYEWDHGCTYWLPGPYDVEKASRNALQPFSDLQHFHLVGESFSLRQAWMEGALDHATALWNLIRAQTKV